MKRVLTSILIAMAIPAAYADTTGGYVPQVMPEPPPSTLGPVIVQFQESVPVKMRQSIAGVSVGSSHIANVTVHDANTLLITGRAYGTTSLHIIDARGNIIADTIIQVVDQSATRVTVNRAGHDNSFQCLPTCRAAPNVGDEREYFETIVQQGQAISR